MTKITLNDVTNLSNQTSSQNTINNNNDTVVAGIENTLSRDGTSPNAMEANLDMNSNRILNLPEPSSVDQPLRLGDIQQYILNFILSKVPTSSDPGKILRVRDDYLGYDFGNVITDSIDGNTYPLVNDGGSLGTTTNKWSDLFLASGSVINFNSSDVTLTHSANSLSFAGASNGYSFDNNINFDNGNADGVGLNLFSNSNITWSLDNNTGVVRWFSSGVTYNQLTTTALSPGVNDNNALGTSALKWSDLFLADGAVINFNSSNATITHSTGLLTVNVPMTMNTLNVTSSVVPANGMYLPAANTLGFAVNTAAEVQLTSTALSPAVSDGNALGTSSLMWGDLFLASGGVVSFNNTDWIATHSTGILTVGTGDLRVTNAGTNSASVVTVGGTQTLTNKTLTSPTLTTPSLGVATATSINKVAITAPTTSATLTIPDGVTLTGPASSGTAMTLGNAEVVTGAKTFGAAGNVGKLIVAGTTSGTTILNATAIASGTLTLPASTDTLVGKATTDTLTNKTLTTPVIASIVNSGTLTLPTSTDTLVGRNTTDTLTNKTLTSPVINTPTGIVKGDVGLGNVDNTSDATKNAAAVTLTNKTIAYGSNTPTGFTALAGNQNLTGGFTTTSDGDGTLTTGTYTPDPLTGNFKHITANGAFTFAPPSTTCTLIVEVTNGASASTITTSGFTFVTGDAFTTTNGNKFLCFVTKSQNYSHLFIQTLQ